MRLPRKPVLAVVAALAAWGSASATAEVANATGLFVSDNGSASVSPFSINGDGSLTPVACDPLTTCAAGSNPEGTAIDPTGRFLYVASGTPGEVAIFAIGTDGTAVRVPCTTPNCAAPRPFGIAVAPSGRFLYTTSPDPDDSVSAFAVGTDGKLTPVPCNPVSNCASGHDPAGVAVAPSGRFLYVANNGADSISTYKIESNGSITPVPCSPISNCATGMSPNGIKTSPSGRFLYVTNISSSSVSVFATADDGTISPVVCNPTSNCNTDNGPQDLAVAPSGRFLYTSSSSAHKVSPFAINADGTLTPIACNPAANCSTPTSIDGIAVSPSERFLYTAGNAGPGSTVLPFAISADGSLAPVPCSPPNCATGASANFQSVAIQPNQGPTAAVQATPARAGQPSAFDASGSTDPDADALRFDWDFGDGTTLANGGAKPEHTYAGPGSYTASVSVADGVCSTFSFTGQEVSCNPSSTTTARTTFTVNPAASVTIPPPLPSLSSVSQSAKRWRLGTKLPQVSRAKVPVGTTFAFSLNEPANAQLRFTQSLPGRRVGKKCVAQTKKNRSKRKCRRTVTNGTLAVKAHAGANKVRFQGRISGRKKLKPGSYKLAITATDAAGQKAGTRSLSFTIVKP
jgi:6-phosphogluconolactonase (cycloisomerase 2 family)